MSESNVWLDRLMGATWRIAHENVTDSVFIFYGEYHMYVHVSFVFKVKELYDTFYVSSPDLIYSDTESKSPCYAGTRDNCQKVAVHLNGILRQAETEVKSG